MAVPLGCQPDAGARHDRGRREPQPIQAEVWWQAGLGQEGLRSCLISPSASTLLCSHHPKRSPVSFGLNQLAA